MIQFVDEFGEVVGDRKEKHQLKALLEITTHSKSDRFQEMDVEAIGQKS